MKKQTINRMYNFPDADLYLQCMERIKYAYRDKEEFEMYGFKMDKVHALRMLCEKFSKLPSDDELLGDQMLTTDKKYAAAEKVKSSIRSLMTRVQMKYSNRTGRYRKFGTQKMGDMTDAQLLFCARRVVRVARAQIDFLADVGVNENVLRKINETAQTFESALNIQQDKVADRDIAVERRMDMGNKIYKDFVTLCEIGKDIWAEKDAKKYENYVIYESNNDEKIARKLETEPKKKRLKS